MTSQNRSFIYSFANQKGGVGKTTTAVNLAAFIAARNGRVLLIDSDPQSNATSSLGIELAPQQPSLYDVLLNNATMAETIIETKRPNLSIAPSIPNLAAAEVEMIQLLARETILKKAIATVAPQYDFIMIDTPPSLGILTINALTASDNGVIIPVQCEYLALEGLSQLMNTIELIRENLNSKLSIAGVVMTMFDSRTNLATDVVQEVQRHFPNHVFETVIPRNVRLSEAPSHGEDILAYAPQSRGCKAYHELTNEFLRRVKQSLGRETDD